MEREQMLEWSTLQDEALRLVRAGAEEKLGGLRLFQLLTLPSFEPNESIEILQFWTRKRTLEYQVVRTTWRMEQDQAKIKSPLERVRFLGPLSPTIDTDARPISVEEVERIRTSLNAITVPVRLGRASAGCDGVFYELRVGAGFTEVSLKWWCDPPEGWEQLAETFHRIVAELREVFT